MLFLYFEVEGSSSGLTSSALELLCCTESGPEGWAFVNSLPGCCMCFFNSLSVEKIGMHLAHLIDWKMLGLVHYRNSNLFPWIVERFEINLTVNLFLG